ncbi:MAG TPA: hypothetical protein VFP64_08150 [Pyrinomonadaceae bacterium]|nr:hypothetical protein [Pyrinomonadaceae bacterium]
MADQSKEKSLEMRVAELEDKLSKVHITEEEMKAYQKVSSLMGGGGGGISPQAGCILDCSGGCISECRVCLIRQCAILQCIIRQPIIRQPIIRACTVECGGECLPGGGGMVGGGGFGGFGV